MAILGTILAIVFFVLLMAIVATSIVLHNIPAILIIVGAILVVRWLRE